jgi:gamma-glutamyl-gamma-aminobutyraldehyde dehydrogenase
MTPLAHFESVARAINVPDRAVIDGHLEPSVTCCTFENVTSRNGTVINRVPECDAGDIDNAVVAARRAFEDGRWRNLHYREKERILIERDAGTLAVLESLDVGKPIKDALTIDVPQSHAVRRLQAIRLRPRSLAPRAT